MSLLHSRAPGDELARFPEPRLSLFRLSREDRSAINAAFVTIIAVVGLAIVALGAEGMAAQLIVLLVGVTLIGVPVLFYLVAVTRRVIVQASAYPDLYSLAVTSAVDVRMLHDTQVVQRTKLDALSILVGLLFRDGDRFECEQIVRMMDDRLVTVVRPSEGDEVRRGERFVFIDQITQALLGTFVLVDTTSLGYLVAEEEVFADYWREQMVACARSGAAPQMTVAAYRWVA